MTGKRHHLPRGGSRVIVLRSSFVEVNRLEKPGTRSKVPAAFGALSMLEDSKPVDIRRLFFSFVCVAFYERISMNKARIQLLHESSCFALKRMLENPLIQFPKHLSLHSFNRLRYVMFDTSIDSDSRKFTELHEKYYIT